MKIKSITLFIFVFILLASSYAHAAGRLGASGKELQISALPPLCESLGQYEPQKCKNLPQIKKLKCDDLRPPPECWGGLKPHLAMAICAKYTGPVTGPSIRTTGCNVPIREQYVVLTSVEKKEELKLLEDQNAFRRFFVPIDNPKEALSYAAALTGSYPKYDFPEKYFVRDMNESGKYTTGKLEPTEVVEKKDGWLVRLFDHTRCGCHRPELYAIEYIVSRDGYVSEKSKKVIWQADRHYQICID